MSFTLKQFDTAPAFVVALKDNFGETNEAAVNLTTASSAVFNMRSLAGSVYISRGSAAITSASTGVVTYNWGTADARTVGSYEAEIEIVWANGTIETFPNDSYWTVSVVDDIA
jgi:hypothetical protein